MTKSGSTGGGVAKKITSSVFEYTKTLIIALILAFAIKTSIVEAYKIPSSSMEDTLLIGDFLLANKFVYGAQIPFTNWRLPAIRKPEPGDVVIFRWPIDKKTNYIKRCVAVEGQTVEIVDKVLYVDKKPFPNPEYSKYTDPQTHPTGTDRRDNFSAYRVPEGFIFCMGDNRDNSYDSRFWGPVSLDLIQGEAILVHWSWTPDAGAPEINLADLATIPAMVGYNIQHFFQRVRWGRLGRMVS
jgi:signal peptidase I